MGIDINLDTFEIHPVLSDFFDLKSPENVFNEISFVYLCKLPTICR